MYTCKWKVWAKSEVVAKIVFKLNHVTGYEQLYRKEASINWALISNDLFTLYISCVELYWSLDIHLISLILISRMWMHVLASISEKADFPNLSLHILLSNKTNNTIAFVSRPINFWRPHEKKQLRLAITSTKRNGL